MNVTAQLTDATFYLRPNRPTVHIDTLDKKNLLIYPQFLVNKKKLIYFVNSKFEFPISSCLSRISAFLLKNLSNKLMKNGL